MKEQIKSNYFIKDNVLYKSCPSCSSKVNKEIFYKCPDFFGYRKEGAYSQSQCFKCRSKNNSGPFYGYIFKEEQDKIIPEIRVLPMSKDIFLTLNDCKDFLINVMPKRDNKFYYKKHNLVTRFNSLILFQYDGNIIAYGFFEDECSDKFNDEFDSYDGYYKFINDSIKLLEVPISNKKMQEIFNVTLGRGTTKISLNYLPKLLEMFNYKDDERDSLVLEKYNKIRVKTIDEWVKILEEEKKRESDKILRIFEFLYSQKDFTSNAGKIAVYLEQEGNMPNLDIVRFGKRVIKLINIEEMYNEKDNNFVYWNIPFTTVPSLNKGIFTYKLRTELIKAIEIVFPDWEKNVDEPLFNIEKEITNIKKRKKLVLDDNVTLNEISLNIVPYKEIDRTINNDIANVPNYTRNALNDVINTYDGKVIEDYIFNLEYDKLKDKISNAELNEMVNYYYNRKDRYGYDILSYEVENGIYVKKYIEVKSTRNEKAPIDITRNEVEFAEANIEHYYLYRVVIVSNSNLQISIISGDELFQKYKLVPTRYKIYGK